MPTMPPIDSPAYATVASSSSSSRPITCEPSRAMSYGPGGASDSPWPRWSKRSTRKSPASPSSWGCHMARVVPSEPPSTTTGASGGPVRSYARAFTASNLPSPPRGHLAVELLEHQPGAGRHDPGDALDLVGDQVAQGRVVRRPDQAEHVVVAGQERGVLDVADLGQPGRHLPPGVLLDADAHVGGRAEAGRLGGDGGVEAGDHPVAEQPVDAGVGVGPGNVQLFGQCPDRGARVPDQRLEDQPVDAVNRPEASCQELRIGLLAHGFASSVPIVPGFAREWSQSSDG